MAVDNKNILLFSRKQRIDAGQTEANYPDWLFLALAETGSGGDDTYSRESPPAGGLFAFTAAQAKLTGREVTDLVGKPTAAIAALIQYMEGTSEIHGYNPEYMALLLATGEEVVKTFKETVESGAGPTAGDQYLSTLWGGTALAHLQRSRAAMLKWSGGESRIPVSTGTLTTVTASNRDVKCRTSSGDQVRYNAAAHSRAADAAAAVRVHLRNYDAAFTGFRINEAGVLDKRAVTIIEGRSTAKTFYLTVKPGDTLGLVWPLNSNKKLGRTSDFGDTRTKGVATATQKNTSAGLDGGIRYHRGIDFSTADDPNQPVFAIYGGVVTRADVSTTYGNVVYVDHGNGFGSRYAHLKQILVTKGQQIDRAHVLGLAGTTQGTKSGGIITAVHGSVRSPHLHFEMLVQRSLIDQGRVTPGLAALLNERTYYHVDPNPLLLGSPFPSQGGAPGGKDPTVANLDAARAAAFDIKGQVTSVRAEADVASLYDTVSAVQRAYELSSMPRSVFWAAGKKNNEEIKARVTDATVVSSLGVLSSL
jgi:murein DD-endopeptidase MepM/ murein hydrolase activator NlpD